MATAQEAKKHKLPTPWAKSSVLWKHTPEFLHGLVERDPSLTGCCPYKNSVFWGHIVQRLCACTNLKIFVCIKNAIFVHFAKFCVPSLWNACFCSLIALGGVRDFRPAFWAVSNLEAIWFIFCYFLGLVFVLPSCSFFISVVVTCFVIICEVVIFVVVACFVIVCVVVVFCVLLLVLLWLLLLLLLLFSCCCCCCCCCCCSCCCSYLPQNTPQK